MNGILGFFGAIFTIAIAVIMELLLEKYGLTEAFYFLAAINFLASILTITFISMLSKQVCEKKTDKIKRALGLSVFKNKKFLIWSVASFFG